MSGVKFHLKSERNLTAAEYSTITNRFGQECRKSLWWLKEGNRFEVIGRHRGDRPLDIELELEPGYYTLGVGEIRQEVRVRAI